MFLGFLLFAALVSLLYFSQPIIMGMADSREKGLVEAICRVAFIMLFVMMLLVVLNNTLAIVLGIGLF